MSNECKCINPDGGGTKCPVQHIALCIRGNDQQCYGECLPIPGDYSQQTPNFNQWLQDSIYHSVNEYAEDNYAQRFPYRSLEVQSSAEEPSGGRMTFRFDNYVIYVKYSFQFDKNRESGTQRALAR